MFFPQWIHSDPQQFSTCNIHSWSIDCYSSGNYLKRKSSCAFLMDCACRLLLYMDRELVWRSVILFSQSLPSTMLFLGGSISPVFTPYFSSASRMTRLDDLESWWRWISLSRSSLLLSGNSVMKRDDDLLPSGFSCKISTFPSSQPFHTFDFYLFVTGRVFGYVFFKHTFTYCLTCSFSVRQIKILDALFN